MSDDSLKVPHGPCYCGSLDSEIRLQTAVNGTIRYVFQCLNCGQPRSNAVKKDFAISLTGGKQPPRWSELLRLSPESRQKRRIGQMSFRDIRISSRADNWWSWYGEYLRSAGWAVRRRQVIDRCGDVCEGCGQAPVEEIHHKTYDHVGEEFLFELAGLCGKCHDRYHGVGITGEPV